MATSNDQELVKRIVEKSHSRDPLDSCLTKHFEIFASQHILKLPKLSLKKLSLQHLKEGNVGGSLDKGIDGLYLFVNRKYVSKDNQEEFDDLLGSVQVDLFIIQTKLSLKSPTGVFDQWMTSARELLNSQRHLTDLANDYEPLILQTFQRYRDILATNQCATPEINFHFYYVTTNNQRPSDIDRRLRQLITTIKDVVPECNVKFDFLRATDTLKLIRKQPWDLRHLQLTGTPITVEGDKSLVALVNLRDYLNFVSKEDGSLQESLFDSNVRAWQGENTVNKNIQSSLKFTPVKHFWWLNNGVTIVAMKISNHVSYLRLENPVIVNGLQTTYAIHNFFSVEGSDANTDQTLLVRAVEVSDDDESDDRERIIQATNSQTAVSDAQLRALDKIQYDIELYFNTLDQPLYYERRLKYYANLGKSRNQIVTVLKLTQAVLATAQFKPDDARGRPKDYLRSSTDSRYKLVFDHHRSPSVYEFCFRFYEKVEYLLNNHPTILKTDRAIRGRLRYFIMTHIILRHLNISRPVPYPRVNLLAEQKVGDISDDLMLDSAKKVIELHKQVISGNGRFTWRRFENIFLKELDRLLPSKQDAASS